LVHQALVPLSTKRSPRRSARVDKDTASDPEPGSLIDSAPIFSPNLIWCWFKCLCLYVCLGLARGVMC
jgi:hypothetical protein